MEIINQVLVIGERMHSFHVSTLDAIVVIDNFEHWGDGIGGARGGGDNGIVRSDVGVIDTIDHVFEVTLTRCGEYNTRATRGLEMLLQPGLVPPPTSVVDHDGVGDAIAGVVDAGRVVGINDLDFGAVGPNDVVFLIDGDGAVEGAVHGVPAQQ